MLLELEEYRSFQCLKLGGEHHRRCTDWTCECPCHDEREDE